MAHHCVPMPSWISPSLSPSREKRQPQAEMQREQRLRCLEAVSGRFGVLRNLCTQCCLCHVMSVTSSRQICCSWVLQIVVVLVDLYVVVSFFHVLAMHVKNCFMVDVNISHKPIISLSRSILRGKWQPIGLKCNAQIRGAVLAFIQPGIYYKLKVKSLRCRFMLKNVLLQWSGCRRAKKPLQWISILLLNSDAAFYCEIIYEEIILVLVAYIIEEWLIMANILFWEIPINYGAG